MSKRIKDPITWPILFMIVTGFVCGVICLAIGNAEYAASIIAIVVLYLAIALGCKIWNMADDIKDIRDILVKENDQKESSK